MERDNFMSAQQALEFGLIDKILTKPGDDLESAKSK
jgi:ATP-dependent protease ClpP protease subunit